MGPVSRGVFPGDLFRPAIIAPGPFSRPAAQEPRPVHDPDTRPPNRLGARPAARRRAAAGRARRPAEGIDSRARLRAGGLAGGQLPLGLHRGRGPRHRGGGRRSIARRSRPTPATPNSSSAPSSRCSPTVRCPMPSAPPKSSWHAIRPTASPTLRWACAQIKAGQWAAARQNFSRSGRGAANDLTATLLTAWSYAGAGDGKKALETVNKLRGSATTTPSAITTPG